MRVTVKSTQPHSRRKNNYAKVLQATTQNLRGGVTYGDDELPRKKLQASHGKILKRAGLKCTKMADQIKHCLEQIARFSKMLRTGDFQGRSRDAVMGQLFFNLGRYVELVNADGRALWRQFEAWTNAGDYTAMEDYAIATLAEL